MTQMFQRPKLDAKKFKDPRSRNYGIRPLVGAVTRKKQLWRIPTALPLNQGSEGACVGFGWSAELAVEPVQLNVSNAFARVMFEGSRRIDREMGNNYPMGASLLAGAKFAQQQGWISEYRWAFGIDDVVDTLVAKGPVVLGINWYDGMYSTETDGRVRINGNLIGGHCILATGYIPNHPVWGGNWIEWVNSWGWTYGVKGLGYIREADLDRLLRDQGEACIATDIAPPEYRKPWWTTLWNRFQKQY